MRKKEATVLIVDDDSDILFSIRISLKKYFSEIITTNNPKKISSHLTEKTIDVILLDMNYRIGFEDGKEGLYWLKHIKEISPETTVILMTAFGSVNLAVDAIKKGATDFILKPWNTEKLYGIVNSGVELARSKRKNTQLETLQKLNDKDFHNQTEHIIGRSDVMQSAVNLAQKVAPTDANILILGENGTGKYVFAKEIHLQSERKNHPFIHVDLGSLNENLFESELFGYVKGAFTDAQKDTIGRFELAKGGTIFLDEIGNLPLHLQAKLLTVLEQRQVTPLGSNKAQPFNVRVIAATNIPPEVLNNESKFRQDLLFRLNTVTLNLPPLRERKEDIVPIAEHFIALYSKKYNKSVNSLTSDTKQVLLQEPWQGNIRALRHAIERAVILTEHADLQISDFQLEQKAQQNFNQMTDKAPNAFLPDNAHMENDLTEELTLEEMEKKAITAALKKHRYNISHCAKALGLTRAALYRRMEKYGL